MCLTSKLAALVTAAMITFLGLHPAVARGGLSLQDLWSPSHIEELPPEVRVEVYRATRGCGGPIAARRLFSRYIQDHVSGDRFIALHFEEIRCSNQTAVCRAEGCLHQVYVSRGGRYRRVWNGYAHEIALRHIDDRAAVAIACEYSLEDCVQLLRWNRNAFLSRHDSSSPILRRK